MQERRLLLGGVSVPFSRLKRKQANAPCCWNRNNAKRYHQVWRPPGRSAPQASPATAHSLRCHLLTRHCGQRWLCSSACAAQCVWKTWPHSFRAHQSSVLVSEDRQMTHCTPGMVAGSKGTLGTPPGWRWLPPAAVGRQRRRRSTEPYSRRRDTILKCGRGERLKGALLKRGICPELRRAPRSREYRAWQATVTGSKGSWLASSVPGARAGVFVHNRRALIAALGKVLAIFSVACNWPEDNGAPASAKHLPTRPLWGLQSAAPRVGRASTVIMAISRQHLGERACSRCAVAVAGAA